MNKPSIIYGTAWKEERTTDLVKTALSVGFSAVDTANQPKHYQETLVGEAMLSAFNEGIKREDFFIQTKFTPPDGQDNRIPYELSANLTTQVKQSFASSLKNLHTDYVDSYLLHGPYSRFGLGNSDWEVWHEIEDLYRTEKVRRIGISNVSLEQLETLHKKAEIKPMVVQNRCYADQGWDREVREFCIAHDIIYQGFSLLTANPYVLQDNRVKDIARGLGKTAIQVVFRLALQIGITPLTGTTNKEHMKEDLEIFDFELSQEEVEIILNIGV